MALGPTYWTCPVCHVRQVLQFERCTACGHPFSASPSDSRAPVEGIRFINRMLNSYFRRTVTGQKVFYPWGVVGSGYFMTDENQENRIRRFLKRFYLTFFVLWIISVATIGHFGILLFIPVGIAIWLVRVFFWARAMTVTQLRYTNTKPL
jgi:hypothetical protein